MPATEEKVAVVQVVMTERWELRAGEQLRVPIQQPVKQVSRSAVHHAELGSMTQRVEEALTTGPTLAVQLAEGFVAYRLQ
jgi:hypothetical protein